MDSQQLSQRLHVRLAKASVRRPQDAVDISGSVSEYALRRGIGFGGRLYVLQPKESPPQWLQFVQTGVREDIRELSNRTNAAVLIAHRRGRLYAFTFGHGRHLLKDEAFESDFGLKTALNALEPTTLRSVDSFTIEDQTVHHRSQASRASGIEVFGIDIGRDILRAVTGEPRASLPLRGVTGVGPSLSLSVKTDFAGLGPLMDLLLTLYRKREYKKGFSWVDNIRRVSDPSRIATLDHALVLDLQSTRPTSYLAPPEPVEWEEIDGFDYTFHRKSKDIEMRLADYLENVDKATLDAQTLKRHRVLVYKHGESSASPRWRIHDCLVFETLMGGHRYSLVAGDWFEVESNFAKRVRTSLNAIPVASVQLPPVVWLGGGRPEHEGEYNARAAGLGADIALLDEKLARCQSAPSRIEICDLLSASGEIVHVKHRKGGSSTLSHLFAQARVSAEALTRDAAFREDARRYLSELNPLWEDWIPADQPDTTAFIVVLAILGASAQHPGDELPFFSQLNLVRAVDTIRSMGYRAAVIGVPIAAGG